MLKGLCITLAVICIAGSLSFADNVTNISSCQWINEPGEYRLTQNLTGAPLNVSGIPGIDHACIGVNSSNVIFDGGGFYLIPIIAGASSIVLLATVANQPVKITNVVIRQKASEAAETGVAIRLAKYVRVEDSSSSGNTDTGVYVFDSENVTLARVVTRNNTGSGFRIYNSTNVTIVDSSASDSGYGYNISLSDNTRVEGSGASGNILGIALSSSNGTNISGMLFQNNSEDTYIENPAVPYEVSTTLSEVVYASPAGTGSTRLSLTDDVPLGEAYAIDWAPVPPALPPGMIAFGDKFVSIENVSGPVDIGSVTWHWSQSEVSGYAEEAFSLWSYGELWGKESAALDILENTLTILGLNPASSYGILQNGTLIDLYGANTTNISRHARYSPAAGSAITEGGNISGMNVSGAYLTDRWAAFYGDVAGSIVLADQAGAGQVYSWGWSAADGGVVCLSTNGSLGQEYVQGAQGTDIDGAWSFAGAVSDSGNKTFNNTNCTLNVGAATVQNASYADTGPIGGFHTCALRTADSPSKDEMAFCSRMIPGGAAWNGGTADFEVMVPTSYGLGASETYYLYLNLN